MSQRKLGEIKMTNASGIQYGSGFRYGVVFEIDQVTGRLKGTSPSVPYMGETLKGGKAWNLSIPKQRRIFHIDADRVGAADFLPPTEAASAVINTSADNMVLDAILTGNKVVNIGTAATIADLTSQQGFEPLIALLLWQQSLDSVTRLRTWRSFLIPRAKAIPMLSGFADKEVDSTYDVLMTPSSTTIFGVSLSTSIDGGTDAQLFRAMTAGRPAIAAWLADGYTSIFTFPAGYTPTIDVGSVAVYVNGVLVTVGITVTTTSVTFSVAPLANDDVNIFWQY
jgi:hypothetical protein